MKQISFLCLLAALAVPSFAPAAPVPAGDFSAQEPGATDLATLEVRFRSVEEKVQSVTRLSTLRQFAQARDALEAAKAAEDAVTVGQVLSWAERVLQ